MAHHTRTPVLAPFPGPPSPSPKTRAPPPRALFTNCTFFAQFRLPPPLPTPIHPKDGRRRGIVSPRHTTNPFSPSPFSLSLSLPHARARALSVRSKGFSTDLAPHRSRLLASYVRTIVLYYTILYRGRYTRVLLPPASSRFTFSLSPTAARALARSKPPPTAASAAATLVQASPSILLCR